ncbi:uncharacterized protein LOC144145600 isoform X6 [Haemaphysalis longicornis]
MGDTAPGPSRGRGRPKKYATAEEARAARNSARRNRRREEAATDEAAAAARREQHAALMRRRRSENVELVRREAAAARAKRAALRGEVQGAGQVVAGAARATAKYKKDCVGSPIGAMPCLRHSCGQLADQLTCVPVGLTETMLPCTCGKELNGTSPPQHTDSEATTTTIKTEPEESAASDEEFMEMPLAIEMGIGEEPCNPAVAVKEEPPDIPAASTGNAGDANEILGVTGIETLALPSERQAEEGLEDKPRMCKEEAHSTCLP